MFCTVSLLVYSSVALDASVRVGSSYLRVVSVLILAVPLLVPRVASPSVVRQLLLMLRSDTLPSARSQWALPTALVELPERADVEKATILVTSKTFGGEPRKNLAVGRGHLHGRPLDVLAPPLSVAVIDGGALSTV